ncbi:MAG: uracil-DNA glycosylase [Bacteroidales bacterium]|nr:uracil-DNA glycosylase [Candidatus Physcousia equi]
MTKVKIEESWAARLSSEFEKPYFDALTEFVRQEYASGICYPPGKLIFNAFNQTPFDKVKVVILGQDPYHGPGQAHGLCFSVPEGVAAPPSLVNIMKEVGHTGSTDLTRWAHQGVFLLNTCLSVRQHQAFSHSGKGWETFTDAVIRLLSDERDHLVFLLWGGPAGKKASLIDEERHLVLRSAHPSPLSAYRGFFGNHHFEICNQYLAQHGQEPIQW